MLVWARISDWRKEFWEELLNDVRSWHKVCLDAQQLIEDTEKHSVSMIPWELLLEVSSVTPWDIFYTIITYKEINF